MKVKKTFYSISEGRKYLKGDDYKGDIKGKEHLLEIPEEKPKQAPKTVKRKPRA